MFTFNFQKFSGKRFCFYLSLLWIKFSRSRAGILDGELGLWYRSCCSPSHALNSLLRNWRSSLLREWQTWSEQAKMVTTSSTRDVFMLLLLLLFVMLLCLKILFVRVFDCEWSSGIHYAPFVLGLYFGEGQGSHESSFYLWSSSLFFQQVVFGHVWRDWRAVWPISRMHLMMYCGDK